MIHSQFLLHMPGGCLHSVLHISFMFTFAYVHCTVFVSLSCFFLCLCSVVIEWFVIQYFGSANSYSCSTYTYMYIYIYIYIYIFCQCICSRAISTSIVSLMVFSYYDLQTAGLHVSLYKICFCTNDATCNCKLTSVHLLRNMEVFLCSCDGGFRESV